MYILAFIVISCICTWLLISKKSVKIHLNKEELKYVEYFESMQNQSYDFFDPSGRKID